MIPEDVHHNVITTIKVQIQSNGRIKIKNHPIIAIVIITTDSDQTAVTIVVPATIEINSLVINETVIDPKAHSNAHLHLKQTQTDHPEINRKLGATVARY